MDKLEYEHHLQETLGELLDASLNPVEDIESYVRERVDRLIRICDLQTEGTDCQENIARELESIFINLSLVSKYDRIQRNFIFSEGNRLAKRLARDVEIENPFFMKMPEVRDPAKNPLEDSDPSRVKSDVHAAVIRDELEFKKSFTYLCASGVFDTVYSIFDENPRQLIESVSLALGFGSQLTKEIVEENISELETAIRLLREQKLISFLQYKQADQWLDDVVYNLELVE